MHKVVLGEYSVLNISENFGGGDFSPGKIEFGVVVVRLFLVVRVSIPGVNCGDAAILQLRQPERLQSEKRVSLRSATRRQKRRHQWLGTYYVLSHRKRSTSKLE